MAIRLGKVTGRQIAANRDGSGDRLLLQVEMSNADDVQTVEMLNAPGEDSNPPDDAQVLIVDLGRAFKVALAADDGITPDMAEGEKKLYSVSAGAVAAFIKFLASGVLELNGNADFAVRFSELETAFNQLKSDHDTHSHLYTPGAGTPTQTAAPAAGSTADISGAKVDTVKFP